MGSHINRRSDLVRRTGAGIVAGILSIVCTILVAASTVNVLSDALEDIGTLVAVAIVALLIGLGIGIRYRGQWLTPTSIAGGLTGIFLFLRGQLFLTEGIPISYPLLFGLPGTAAAVIFILGGGWLGNQSTVTSRLSPSELSPRTRAGLIIASGWTVIEFLFGLGMGSSVGILLDNTFVGILVATLVGFPVAALFAVRYGHRVDIDHSDWEYVTDSRAVSLGFLAGAFTVLTVYGIGFVNAMLGGTETAVAAFGFLLSDLEAGLWVVVLFALAHGLIAPVTEELAWRGIVQTALVRGEGVTTGIIITAVIFTAKHALLDVSLVRVPTILVLALVLGIVRHRWGTTASTVVHMVVNLTSVGLLAIYVLG
ncbi:type II CAAX prenyl endopeptidase Rce1 family protein [Halomicroarcula sp. GCM10025324]|uniref:CPBP family intramembrane glutamic endopeptidase n=1 Tax=Haloarcula TaxID=2237 RepID=UPI0023E84B96|nr:CPBP family intramembrane glutamic endopeptidase [Halomicroarcula sp. ZS-22-S1]